MSLYAQGQEEGNRAPPLIYLRAPLTRVVSGDTGPFGDFIEALNYFSVVYLGVTGLLEAYEQVMLFGGPFSSSI